MALTISTLDRVVLEAVSEDYEPFEAVVRKLSNSTQALGGANEIERSLLSSIANNFIEAYLIHADPPYATAVGANLDTVRRYWFYITEQGKEHLRRLL
jgi:hypothetical protein